MLLKCHFFNSCTSYIHSGLTYINFHLYQHVFWPRFSPMSHSLDSVTSRFIYINIYNRNRQVDISETEVYISKIHTSSDRVI